MSKQLQVTMTEEMHRELKDFAEGKGGMNHHAREAIKEYLAQRGILIDMVHPSWGGPRPKDDG